MEKILNRSDPEDPPDRTFTGKSNGIMGCRTPISPAIA